MITLPNIRRTKIRRHLPLTLIAIMVIALGCIKSLSVSAATTPSLGAAASYGVLATTYTNSAAGTTVNGDVGFAVGPAVEPNPVGGHANYGSGGPYVTAGADQATALSALNSQGCTFSWPGAVDLSLDVTHGPAGTYTPGVYCSPGAFTQTGTITLDGAGTYIFRSVGAYTTTAGVSVLLTGGASACEVFWTPHATTLGAGTNLVGTLIDNDAVTAGANSSILGRILAFNGPVTTTATTINVPSCTPPPATLHVVKQVVNNSGGTAIASNFSLHVKNSGVDVAGSPANGAAAPGTPYSLAAGTYVVSEDANAGYAQSFSGDCNASGSVTLAPGEDKTCTITNDDIPSTITVVKVVINNSGRTKTIADFPLFVGGTPVTSGAANAFSPGSYTVSETVDPDYAQTFSGDCNVAGTVNLNPGDAKVCTITNDDIGAPVIIPPVPPLITVVKVPSPLTLPTGPGLVTYTYTLRNIGTVTATNLTMNDDSCSPVTYVSGDANANAQLEVGETWTYTCATMLTATHTNTVTATGLANGITATDTASATVVVGSPLVPPLIHVTNIPSVLALIAGGGPVTFTQNVTNPGTAPLSNVTVTNNACLLTYISGDVNGDSELDPTENWIYSCQMTLAKTLTSTTTATGQANGLTARDFALATVVVGDVLPGAPNTGVGPGQRHENGLGVGALTALALLCLAGFSRRIAQKSADRT